MRRKVITGKTGGELNFILFFLLPFLILVILFCQRVRLCAEGQRPRGHSAAHPVADTQSGGRAAEDQSGCEKGQQLASWNTEVRLEATV